MVFDVVNDLAAPMNLAVEGGGEVIRLIDAYDGVTISGVTEPNAQVGIVFWEEDAASRSVIGDADDNGDFEILYPRAELPVDGDYTLRVKRVVDGFDADSAEIPISIIVDPVRTVLSCESGTRGGRYNFSKPSFTEETQWVDIAPNGDVLRNGLTTGELNNLTAVGSVTDLDDGFYRWSHSVPIRPYTGTNYNLEYALDGVVRSYSSGGYAPVGLVVTRYTRCIRAGDGSSAIPAAPSIDAISGDDIIAGDERRQSIAITGRGMPGAVVTVRTSFGYEESARVNADGLWSALIFNLQGQTLQRVSGEHAVTAFVRFNQQNSTIASRSISIAVATE